MTFSDYMSDVAQEMAQTSEMVRRDFASHHLSAGENREDIVRKFLSDHLPSRFGIDSGLVISSGGVFSNQADLLVVDEQNNPPLYAGYRHRLWPVESVYALIEVKAQLTPAELRDAIEKGRRFKSMRREFCPTGTPQRMEDSLFLIWAFDSAQPSTLKDTLIRELADIELAERPDLIVVPDKLVAMAGTYHETVRLGQPDSPYRREIEANNPAMIETVQDETAVVYDLGKNSLLVWSVWFDSWLRQAGSRFTDPIRYLPDRIDGGHTVA